MTATATTATAIQRRFMAHTAAFRNPGIELMTAIAIRFIDNLLPARIVTDERDYQAAGQNAS
jgi:hypothetical protein